MRLGIFGGTFDPVHYGHLLLAELCREQARLDQVWFLPAATPPHKSQREITSAAQRIEMLELALSGNPHFEICTLEVDRGGVNYTFQTLEDIDQQRPHDELFFLLGADSLNDFPRWRQPARICQLATPLVVVRPGTESLDWKALEEIVGPARTEQIQDCQVQMPEIGLSSSEIRRRVASGESIRYQTTRAVEKFIHSHGLYR